MVMRRRAPKLLHAGLVSVLLLPLDQGPRQDAPRAPPAANSSSRAAGRQGVAVDYDVGLLCSAPCHLPFVEAAAPSHTVRYTLSVAGLGVLPRRALGSTATLQIPVMPHIRDARPEDVPALCAAERALVQGFDGMLVSEPDEIDESRFIERLKAISGGKGKYLVVEEKGLLVAHASLWPMGLKKVSHVLSLDMCVHVGHWRQGHGERLLRALIVWARAESRGYKIELLVRAENEPAIALYRKLGFCEEGRLKHRVRLRSGRYIDDIPMALFFRPSAAS